MLDPADPATPIEPPAPVSLGTVAHAALSAQVAALIAHEPHARLGEDPEAVHQMRVATRRLRAALRLFAEVLPAPADELRTELAWLAEHLGSVRDLDVQIASIGHAAADVQADSEAIAPVLSAFESRRAAARQTLIDALDGPRYAALIGSLSAVVAQPPETWPGRALLPATDTLPDLVRARYRRFRKATRGAGATSPAADLHRARIRAKQLRYSLEFVADLYGKRARVLIRRTVRLQDVLGAIQDAAVMDQRLRSLGLAGSELPGQSVFLLGQLAQCYAQHAEASRTELAAALKGVSRRRWNRLERRFRRPLAH